MDKRARSIRFWAAAAGVVGLALLLMGGAGLAAAAKGGPSPAGVEGISHAPDQASNGKAHANANASQGSANSSEGIGNAPYHAANGKAHANSKAFKAGATNDSPTPSPSPDSQTGVASPTPSPPPGGIVSGSGVVEDGRCVNFGTGNICYSTAGDGVRGYLYGSSFSSPPAFFADVVPESPCAPNYPGYRGVSNIAEFTSAASHAFSSPHAIVIGVGWCALQQGVLLFQQDGMYGGLEFTEIDQNQALHFQFWYDSSGGSDFSSAAP